MNVVFDYQTFCLQKVGGVSRYIVNLSRALLDVKVHSSIYAPIHQNLFLDNECTVEQTKGLYIKSFPRFTSKIFMEANEYFLKNYCKRLKANIIHRTYYNYNSRNSSIPIVLTVHDLIHEKFPQYFPSSDVTSSMKKLAIARADHIVCISSKTKEDLQYYYDVPESKISIVHHGCNDLISIDNSEVNPAIPSRNFLLYVGSRGGYKNFDVLLYALANSSILKRDLIVVAFGGGPFSNNEIALINSLNLTAHVFNFQGNDSLLHSLYRRATAMVFTSVYEGFGMPLLEAMQAGCPVISSNSSVMPEVAGNAAEYFEPLDYESLIFAISNVVHSSHKSKIMKELGYIRSADFTWENCALKTKEVYTALLA
jgi:glycosyltransferase involved in cell wall biosynthesis